MAKNTLLAATAAVTLLAGCAANDNQASTSTPYTTAMPGYVAPTVPVYHYTAPEAAPANDDQPLQHPTDGAYPVILSNDHQFAVIVISGEIRWGDEQRFFLAVRDTAALFPHARGGIMLNSPGGNPFAAEKIAIMIHRANVPVFVPPHGMCASACFLLFAAGGAKAAASDALIGVHRAANGDEREDRFSIMTSVLTGEDYAILRVPQDITYRMLSTPPDGMAWLTPDELAEMGVRIID